MAVTTEAAITAAASETSATMTKYINHQLHEQIQQLPLQQQQQQQLKN